MNTLVLSSKIVIFIIAFLVATTANAEFVFEIFRGGIIQVGTRNENENIQWHGTGFVVDKQCTFVTAKHVLKDKYQSNIVIKFQDPNDRTTVKTVDARIMYSHPKTDLIFLRVDPINGNPCNSGDLHVFNLPGPPLKSSLVGEDIWIIGHPIIGEKTLDIPVLRKGTIASTEISLDSQKMLLLDLIGVPGFSGSPVILRSSGEVIGVVYGPGPTDRGYGFEFASPVTIQDYKEAIRISK